MNTKIAALMAILDDETDCYQTMSTILEDEYASISLSNKQRFDDVQYEKGVLVVKLQLMERKRKQMVEELSEACHADTQPKTVSQLARFVKPPQSDQLMACAYRLRAIIGDVQKKNNRNQMRINQYLDLVSGSLKLLTDLIDGSPVYRKPGSQSSAVGFQNNGGRFIRGTV